MLSTSSASPPGWLGWSPVSTVVTAVVPATLSNSISTSWKAVDAHGNVMTRSTAPPPENVTVACLARTAVIVTLVCGIREGEPSL